MFGLVNRTRHAGVMGPLEINLFLISRSCETCFLFLVSSPSPLPLLLPSAASMGFISPTTERCWRKKRREWRRGCRFKEDARTMCLLRRPVSKKKIPCSFPILYLIDAFLNHLIFSSSFILFFSSFPSLVLSLSLSCLFSLCVYVELNLYHGSSSPSSIPSRSLASSQLHISPCIRSYLSPLPLVYK